MITFSKTAIQKNISSKDIHEEIFTGVNISNDPVKLVSHKPSCGCTTAQLPTDIGPNETFEIKMFVNKQGQSGFYSVDLNLTFSTGERIRLNLNGEIV